MRGIYKDDTGGFDFVFRSDRWEGWSEATLKAINSHSFSGCHSNYETYLSEECYIPEFALPIGFIT